MRCLLFATLLLGGSLALAQAPNPAHPEAEAAHPTPATTAERPAVQPAEQPATVPAEGAAQPASQPAADSSSSTTAAAILSAPVKRKGEDFRLSQECIAHERSAKECRVHWGPVFAQAGEFLAVQTVGNIAKDQGIRYSVTHLQGFDDFADRWFTSVDRYRYLRWSDDAPFLDHYVGHPFMGGITNAIWIQNDPMGQTLELHDKGYWKSRLRATVFTCFYDVQWKLGPVSEASIGNAGYYTYLEPTLHIYTNDTGLAPIVTTPVGGFLWTLAEDTLDHYVVKRLDQKTQNPLLLFSLSFMNPARGFANILRFKAPWHRDTRHVAARWRKPKQTAEAESAPEKKSP